MIDISEFLHFSFTVYSVKRSIRFYTEFLGFELRTSERYPDGIREEKGNYVARVTGYPDVHLKMAILEKGPFLLELIEYASPRAEDPRAPETYRVGCPHLAFIVEDLNAEYEKLVREKDTWGLTLPPNGIVEVDSGPNKGGKAVYFRDPDGVTLELVQKACP